MADSMKIILNDLTEKQLYNDNIICRYLRGIKSVYILNYLLILQSSWNFNTNNKDQDISFGNLISYLSI